MAAQALKEVTEVFEEGNPIVLIAKKMAEQMSEMAEYTRGRGGLQVRTSDGDSHSKHTDLWPQFQYTCMTLLHCRCPYM